MSLVGGGRSETRVLSLISGVQVNSEPALSGRSAKGASELPAADDISLWFGLISMSRRYAGPVQDHDQLRAKRGSDGLQHCEPAFLCRVLAGLHCSGINLPAAYQS